MWQGEWNPAQKGDGKAGTWSKGDFDRFIESKREVKKPKNKGKKKRERQEYWRKPQPTFPPQPPAAPPDSPPPPLWSMYPENYTSVVIEELEEVHQPTMGGLCLLYLLMNLQIVFIVFSAALICLCMFVALHLIAGSSSSTAIVPAQGPIVLDSDSEYSAGFITGDELLHGVSTNIPCDANFILCICSCHVTNLSIYAGPSSAPTSEDEEVLFYGPPTLNEYRAQLYMSRFMAPEMPPGVPAEAFEPPAVAPEPPVVIPEPAEVAPEPPVVAPELPAMPPGEVPPAAGVPGPAAEGSC